MANIFASANSLVMLIYQISKIISTPVVLKHKKINPNPKSRVVICLVKYKYETPCRNISLIAKETRV